MAIGNGTGFGVFGSDHFDIITLRNKLLLVRDRTTNIQGRERRWKWGLEIEQVRTEKFPLDFFYRTT